jgi:hypothetical protein
MKWSLTDGNEVGRVQVRWLPEVQSLKQQPPCCLYTASDILRYATVTLQPKARDPQGNDTSTWGSCSL